MSDIYLDILKAMNLRRISYIVIGMSGINYYAENASQTMMTGDFDIFLKPDIKNVTKALQLLQEQEFSASTSKAAIRDLDRETVQSILDDGLNIACTTLYGHSIDLCLSVSGFTYDEMNENVKKVKVAGSSIRVGRLRDLLRSKEIADRPKDRMFLKRYRLLLEEEKERRG